MSTLGALDRLCGVSRARDRPEACLRPCAPGAFHGIDPAVAFVHPPPRPAPQRTGGVEPAWVLHRAVPDHLRRDRPGGHALPARATRCCSPWALIAAAATRRSACRCCSCLLIVAAVLGDAVNYAIGYRLGPKVFKYENSWLLNKKHLLEAQAFYEKYGSKTIILARFVPIVRTFAPFVAGIGKMNYSRFGFFNVLGGVAWVADLRLQRLLLRRHRLGEGEFRGRHRGHHRHVGAAHGGRVRAGMASCMRRAAPRPKGASSPARPPENPESVGNACVAFPAVGADLATTPRGGYAFTRRSSFRRPIASSSAQGWIWTPSGASLLPLATQGGES